MRPGRQRERRLVFVGSWAGFASLTREFRFALHGTLHYTDVGNLN